MNTSFIGYTLNTMAAKGNMMAAIARTVLESDGKEFANQIATAYVSVNQEARLARRTNNVPQIAPELFLNFVQNLQNQCCWAARRLINAQQSDEAMGEAANGIDFNEELKDEMGMHIELEHLEDIMVSDNFVLGNLHGWLSAQLSYLSDIEPFYMYADREPIEDGMGGEIWEITSRAESWNEALAIMENLITRMQDDEEDNLKKIAQDAGTLDFESHMELTPVEMPQRVTPIRANTPPSQPDKVASRGLLSKLSFGLVG